MITRSRKPWIKAVLGVVALLGTEAALAQDPPMPSMPAHSNPADPPTEDPDRSTHAPDPALERAAASEKFMPPMMPGMDMDDASIKHRVWIENLEGVFGSKDGVAWDGQAWLGGDFDKLWLKTEGSRLGNRTQDAKVEALWAHAILPFWDSQLGVRHDFGGGPSREWAAFGIQGISPYWFDIELTVYFGEEGRTALRLKTEYDLYLTQRLILKPEIELNAYGKPDRARDLGAGLADGQFELRLRYEFTRRFAPYVGYVYDRKFAGSATLARNAGDPATDHRAVAGVGFSF
jgi:copper resistance protein B